MQSVTYRPELDGLRGLAILLVLLAHAAPALQAAGFVGVGIFFVLSGYLITGVLLRDGRLGRFYVRRIARLAPPLVITLVVLLATGWTAGLLPAALYVANWPIAAGADFGPIQHAWSLSIEEQFYLVFPFALPFLARRPRLVLGLALASALVRFGLPWQQAYFGTPARLDGLLVGAALAISGFRLSERVVLPALLLVAVLTLTGPVPSAWALGLVTIAGTVLVASTPRILSPLAPLGRISYSLYLYHYPLALAFGPVGIAAAIPLAWASTRFLELPLRAWASGVVRGRVDVGLARPAQERGEALPIVADQHAVA